LDQTGRLRSSAVGLGCARHFTPHFSQSLDKIAARLIRSGAYQQAWETIEGASLSQGQLRRHYLIARILGMVNSGGDEWSRVLQFLIELEKLCAGEAGDLPVAIRAWKEFADSMRLACQSKQGANSDPIGHCCGRGGAASDPINALRLISIRLTWAESMDSPLLATQTILTLPEALIQLYCAAKLQLNYWAPPPLDNSALAEIRKFPQRADFEWPPPGKPLSFNHLLTLGWLKMRDLPTADRLAQDYDSLDQLQQLYAQDRNPLSHHLTFSNQKQWQRYAAECRKLYSRVANLLVAPARRSDAALPLLSAILDTVPPLPPGSPQLSASPSDAIAESIPFDDVRRILGLSHYIESRTLSGGMSGSSVKLVEFRPSANQPLRLGILKITTKESDFKNECQGSNDAKSSWLKDHVATFDKTVSHGPKHYILSPLAFKATENRHIQNLHELLVSGDPRTPGIFHRLGDLYGAKLGATQTTPGTPQAHLRRIWEHWRDRAVDFEWSKWGFPGLTAALFADGRQNWVNPLACLENKEEWSSADILSLAWGWQHRDLNLRNVLVAPATTPATPATIPFLFIDLEKVSQSSALMDICWSSLWALQAGSERAGVQDATWDLLPDAFLRRARAALIGAANGDEPDLGSFEYGVSCVSKALRALFAAATSVGDPVVLKDSYEITLGAAALAKSFYEIRDLERARDAGEHHLCSRWQRARCFFRISARSLAPLLVSPRGAPQIDLGTIPDSLTAILE